METVMIDTLLLQYRPLPQRSRPHRVVTWHVFRTPGEAQAYATGIRLGSGQQITGGHDEDSVGPLWWIGVEVDDLNAWGNRDAVNKHAGDP
jgi:hypothetical protein